MEVVLLGSSRWWFSYTVFELVTENFYRNLRKNNSDERDHQRSH